MGKGLDEEKRYSEIIRDIQRFSEIKTSSDMFRDNQRFSERIRDIQIFSELKTSSDIFRDNQGFSEIIRDIQKYSEMFRNYFMRPSFHPDPLSANQTYLPS